MNAYHVAVVILAVSVVVIASIGGICSLVFAKTRNGPATSEPARLPLRYAGPWFRYRLNPVSGAWRRKHARVRRLSKARHVQQ
jgi:hypothetical protein